MRGYQGFRYCGKQPPPNIQGKWVGAAWQALSLVVGDGSLSLDLGPWNIQLVSRSLAYFIQIHASGKCGWGTTSLCPCNQPRLPRTRRKNQNHLPPSEIRLLGARSKPSDSPSALSIATKWSAGTQSSNCLGNGLLTQHTKILLSVVDKQWIMTIEACLVGQSAAEALKSKKATILAQARPCCTP